MKLKTALLTDSALDWAAGYSAVVRECCASVRLFERDGWYYVIEWGYDVRFEPSHKDSHAGLIIDEFRISTVWDGSMWIGSMFDSERESMWYDLQSSSQRLTAAMRCFVLNTLGHEIEVPAFAMKPFGTLGI